MEFKEKYKSLKCEPLKIEEINLSDDKKYRRKIILTNEDVKPEFNKELLQQRIVRIPVLRNQPILPLQLHSNFSDYEFINHGGGVIEILQHVGKEKLNPRDRRYRTPITQFDEKGRKIMPNQFWFYFDHEQERYVNIKDEKKWEEKLQWINDIKQTDDVQKTIWNFFDFYEDYYSSGIIKNDRTLNETFDPTKEESMSNKKTRPIRFRDYLNHIIALENNLYIVEDYIYLLSIFGDIDNGTYNKEKEIIKNLKTVIDKCKIHIHENLSNVLDNEYVPSLDINGPNARTSRLEFTSEVDKLFKPGFFYEFDTKSFVPNVGQLYRRLQPAEKFESENSLLEGHEKEIENITKAANISGKAPDKPIYIN